MQVRTEALCDEECPWYKQSLQPGVFSVLILETHP